MGFWLFLTVVVSGSMALKAYKLRISNRDNPSLDKTRRLESEIRELRELILKNNFDKRLEQLEESVYFGDFELKRKFNKLESEVQDSCASRPRS